LSTAVACAKHFNPDSTVVQIGNTRVGEDRFFDDREFADECEAILGSAKNLGPNGYYFERKCIERWIFISALVQRGDIEVPFIQCDWDVLVLRNLVEVLPLWSDYDYTLGYRAAAMQMLVFNPVLMPCFVQFLKDVYLQGLYPVITAAKAVSDMSLWHHFSCAVPQFKWGETAVDRAGSIFDLNINGHSDLYEFEDGMKKLYFDGGQVCIKRLDTQELIRVNATHCHGRKPQMAGLFAKAKA